MNFSQFWGIFWKIQIRHALILVCTYLGCLRSKISIFSKTTSLKPYRSISTRYFIKHVPIPTLKYLKKFETRQVLHRNLMLCGCVIFLSFLRY